MRRRRAFVAGVIGLLACACSASPPASIPKENRSVHGFLALGDSYTIGEAVDARERWPVQLAARLHALGVAIDEPRIIATTGWTTDELSAAMDQSRFDPPYALVTLLIGVNNQYRGRGLREYGAQFDGLLVRAIHLAGEDRKSVV